MKTVYLDHSQGVDSVDTIYLDATSDLDGTASSKETLFLHGENVHMHLHIAHKISGEFKICTPHYNGIT